MPSNTELILNEADYLRRMADADMSALYRSFPMYYSSSANPTPRRVRPADEIIASLQREIDKKKKRAERRGARSYSHFFFGEHIFRLRWHNQLKKANRIVIKDILNHHKQRNHFKPKH